MLLDGGHRVPLETTTRLLRIPLFDDLSNVGLGTKDPVIAVTVLFVFTLATDSFAEGEQIQQLLDGVYGVSESVEPSWRITRTASAS